MANLVHELLDEAACRVPNKAAVISNEGRISYAELASASRGFASSLAERGVRRGDRVAVWLPNSARVLIAALGASRLGAIATILDPDLKPYGLAQVLSDCRPRLLVTSRSRSGAGADQVLRIESEWASAIDEGSHVLPSSPEPDDPFCLIYTSGSSGTPKGVICAHRNVLFAARAIQSRLVMLESDVVGAFLPLSFDYGLYQSFLTFQVGATLALGEPTQVGPGFLARLVDWQVTGLPLVPTMAAVLVRLAARNPRELPPLRFLTNTGAPLSRTTVGKLQTLFPTSRIFLMYGLTECKRVAILDPRDYPQKPDSVGQPLTGTRCVIVNENNETMPAGSVGELVVLGPHVMLGYWRAPELTRARFRCWGPQAERALFTGDLCSIDDDGFLYWHGRRDEIFKYRDHRTSCAEIEAAATEIPDVFEAALLPPSAECGPILFVSSILSEDEVRAELRERLEDVKLPDRVVVLPGLPRMSNGKVDKNRLRASLFEPVAP
jgi:amino acid adenylation domain-containing protein